MAANVDREARRRRIVDRGNDRFALITGRSPNLSTTEFPSPPSPPARHERAASCPPLDEESRPKFGRSVLTHVNRYDDNGLPGLNNLSEAKIDNGNSRGQSKAIPPLAKSEISSEASSGPPASESSARARPRASSTNPNSSVTTTSSEHGLDRSHEVSRPAAPRNTILAAINPNLIIYSIEVTQPSRLQFSIKVAVLVVLANIGFPIIGWWFIKSLISLMPLHIVLLTNTSYVILQYLDIEERHHVRPHKEPEAMAMPAGNGSNWAEQLGDALQAGILIMRAGRAVFIDVSVYSAIVTCFLCFK